MIAKRVNKTAKIGEDFTRLGEYIAAAREAGEKLDQLWIGNCAAGDSEEDLDAVVSRRRKREVNAARSQGNSQELCRRIGIWRSSVCRRHPHQYR